MARGRHRKPGQTIGRPPVPSKFDDTVKGHILDSLRAGNTRTDAAAYAGISHSTLFEWIRRSKANPEGPFGAFFDEVKKAEADAVVRNVALIQKAATDTWQAAAWWLERKYPEHWSQHRDLIRDLAKRVKDLESQGGTPPNSAPPG